MTARRQFGLLWGWVAVSLVVLSPLAARLSQGLPACPVKLFAGVPCPSCGVTRTALALARLDLGAALAVNPLAAVLWIGLVGGGTVAGLAALGGRPLPLPEPRPTVALRLLLVGVLAANWAYLILSGA